MNLRPRQHRMPRRLAFPALLSVVALSGCSAGFRMSSAPSPQAGVALRGTVHGGQQPVSGSRVYLFAAGTTGYGSASQSLLTTGANIASDGTNNYVTSDVNGNWNITGDWTCPSPNAQLYTLAVGGNPGLPGPINNTAIVLINALGACSSVNASTFVIINEVSTVAGVYALAPFIALDPTTGVDGRHLGTSATNALGLANAFRTVRNLIDTGVPAARSTTPAGNGTVSQAVIHTLANILATCVNTAGPNSTACATLFGQNNYSGNPVADTLTEMLLIAQSPGSFTSQLFALQVPNPPFTPYLLTPPHQFTPAITYSLGSGTPEPGVLAVDSQGNVWATSRGYEKSPAAPDAILKLSPVGALLSGAAGFTAGISEPQGIAIDSSDNVWVANTGGSIAKLSTGGVSVGGSFPITLGTAPQGIAIDHNDNAWIGDDASNSVSEIAASDGHVLVGGVTTSDPTAFILPQGIAIDTAGDVWIAAVGSNSVLELNSTGTILPSSAGQQQAYFSPGLQNPTGIALNQAGGVYVANTNGGQQSRPTFVPVSTNGVGGAIPFSPTSGLVNLIALDGGRNLWTAVCTTLCGQTGPDAVTSTLATPNGGFQFPDLNGPQGIAIDGSGNVWVGNTGAPNGAGTITELIGAGTPTVTPIATASRGNKVGQEP